MTIDLCSFQILTSFSDSTDGVMSGCLGRFFLICNQEEPLHQNSGTLVSKLPLLSKSTGFCLVRACCQLIGSISKILLTLCRMNWLYSLARLSSITRQCYRSILIQILHFDFLKLTSHLLSDCMPYV